MNVVMKPEVNGQKIYHYFDGNEWRSRWETSEVACQMVMENHLEELEPIRKRVLDGELSPLAYHIPANLFNIKLMSSYTGISKRHIKKHLTAKNFEQLDEETLNKYASALGFSLEELKKV